MQRVFRSVKYREVNREPIESDLMVAVMQKTPAGFLFRREIRKKYAGYVAV